MRWRSLERLGPMKIRKKRFLLLVVLVLIGAGVWLKVVKFESGKPWVRLDRETEILGADLGFKAGDERSGLASIKVEAVQGGTTATLLEEAFPAKTFSFEKSLGLRPLPGGFADGEALFRITAEDRSWNGGNKTILEKKMKIDTRPPTMTILGGPHYVFQGGTGCVSYTTNEDIVSSGIRVGEMSFPGYAIGERRFIVFFPLPAGTPAGVSFQGEAEDLAGNRTRVAFRPNVKTKAFKKDRISITERFLADVLPYFRERDASLKGTDIEVFLSINRDLRVKDADRIREICRTSAPSPLWSGPFLRLPNSKPMASFGEDRTYVYEGREIDRQVHLGVDLASLANSPIPAANAGRVVFAGSLGIYGEAVILDHGCGLFSLYAHLSRLDAAEGKDVAKGESLGLSGSTGLAGGDHLHFAMLVQGIFVEPIEWWDAHWIEDNIELKRR
jgi:murein DD-endopeptidase MepM/ murein hydrolase activator NlpD